jgi:hypothetical protein
MNPYIYTVTFLLLMGFLTSSEVIRFTQNTLEHGCYVNFQNALVAAEELREYGHLEELRGEESENSQPKKKSTKRAQKAGGKRIAKLNINSARPPNNSRLNIYSLLHKELHDKLPEEFSLYEVLARLMRSLYKEAPFFAEYPDIEYRLLDKLIEKKEATTHFETPDELCSLSFEDPQLQETFFQMLKGGKHGPSLLNYLTFDKINSTQKPSRKINFLFADPLILKAIFPNETIVEKLLSRREKIWAEILYQEEHRLEMNERKGRRDYAEELEKAIEEVLVSEGLDGIKYKTHIFDYTLGEPGTVIFIEDLLTKCLRREKFTPLPKTKKTKNA